MRFMGLHMCVYFVPACLRPVRLVYSTRRANLYIRWYVVAPLVPTPICLLYPYLLAYFVTCLQRYIHIRF